MCRNLRGYSTEVVEIMDATLQQNVPSSPAKSQWLSMAQHCKAIISKHPTICEHLTGSCGGAIQWGAMQNMHNSQVSYCSTVASYTPPGWTFFTRQAPTTLCIPGLLPSYFTSILLCETWLPEIKQKPASLNQLFCFQMCGSDSLLLLTISALVTKGSNLHFPAA